MWSLYAFDNYFGAADRVYPLSEQCDILRELGYAKLYLSTNLSDPESWTRFTQLPAERRRGGLGLAAAYTVLDFNKSGESKPDVKDMLRGLEPGDTLELALSLGWKKHLSDPAQDDFVVSRLAPLLAQARDQGVTISLYHHFGFWLERIEDCVRIAAKVADPALRVTFCGYHWYACDGADLAGKLRLAAPWLAKVNLCGARRTDPARPFAGALPATIEPVGDGDFPLPDFIAALRAIGYAGDVGFQGYKLGGYPPLTLRRSLEAFRRAASSACPVRLHDLTTSPIS